MTKGQKDEITNGRRKGDRVNAQTGERAWVEDLKFEKVERMDRRKVAREDGSWEGYHEPGG
jgi:hypothetical protein